MKLKKRRIKYVKNFIIIILIALALYLIYPPVLFDIGYLGEELKYGIKNFNFQGSKNEKSIPVCPQCNVIIISLDNLRADRLSSYGYERKTSPNIDELARESIVFKEAFSNGYSVIANHISMITSLYSTKHNINYPDPFRGQGLNNLSKDYKTITEILKENGYETVWFGGKDDNRIGLGRGAERGFDGIYGSLFKKPLPGFKDYRFSNITEDGIGEKNFWFIYSRVNQPPYMYPGQFNHKFTDPNYSGKLPNDEPFEVSENENGFSKMKDEIENNLPNIRNQFETRKLESISSRLNTMTPEQKNNLKHIIDTGNLSELRSLHDDVGPNKLYGIIGWWNPGLYYGTISDNISQEDISQLSDSYDNGIYYIDYSLNKFFDELKKHDLWENTIIVITSHTGKELVEHGNLQNLNFYEHTIHVPLIIRIPGMKTRIEVDQLVQNVDIMPTLLVILGIDIPKQVQGKSLTKTIEGTEEENKYVYGLYSGNSFIRSKKWKYIENEDEEKELYYLLDDPLEKNNLIREKSVIAKKVRETLKNELEKWIKAGN